ncbi:MAG: polysaccharide biosynthesis tyrosine autokinase [Actinomycetia bacterium]|nr:polysaccharide biosynthesis tyrosine autokinase [Actinomycetes bacterium]
MMYQPATAANEAPRLEDYINAVRGRRWVVILCAIAGLLLAMVLASSRSTTYTATSRILVGPTPVNSTDHRLVAPNLETESELIESTPIAQQVADELDLDDPGALLDDIDAQFRPTSEVIRISYTSPDADHAAAVANEFATVYVSERETASIAYYDTEVDQLESDLATVTAQLTTIAERQGELEASRVSVLELDPQEEPTRATQLAAIDSELSSLSSESNTAVSRQRDLQSSLDTIGRDRANRATSARMVATADSPTFPNGISERFIQIGGLMVGLIIGVVTAFFLDRLDTTARSETDVELALGHQVLAGIPQFGMRFRSGSAALVMLGSGAGPAVQRSKEGYRRLRSSLRFLAHSEGLTTFVFTSARPSEGKTVTASNTAIAIAQGGANVVLISADLRRPRVEELFGIPNEIGLSSYLGEGAELNLQEVPSVSGLAIIPAGPIPDNPGELLGSDAFAVLVKEIADQVDFVIIDTPPVLSAADSINAAHSADGVVVVVDSRATDTQALLQIRSDLTRGGARVLGAVLNRDRSRRRLLGLRADRYAYERAASGISGS